MCSVPWPEFMVITFKKQACEDGLILPPEHSVVLIILIHYMMGKVNQVNEFSDVVACCMVAWCVHTRLRFPFTICSQSEHAFVFFGSSELSAALIHIQWLVSYVVLNLYTYMYSDLLWYDIFVNCNWVVTRWQYTFTQTIQNKQYIQQNNFGRVRAVPRLG